MQKLESCLFCVLVLFYAQDIFVKKINRLEIVLITSLYYTTPINATYREFIYMPYIYLYNIYIYIFICNHLRESLFL